MWLPSPSDFPPRTPTLSSPGLAASSTRPALCLLVMNGVRADGRKEVIATADGYREQLPEDYAVALP